MNVLLGFDDGEIGCDQKSWDISKLGGKPDWPYKDLENPVCKLCGQVCALISQVYCPLAGSQYHRVLYIFGCVHKTCWNKNESWIVLRSQYKDETPSMEEKQDAMFETSDWADGADDWGDDDDVPDETGFSYQSKQLVDIEPENSVQASGGGDNNVNIIPNSNISTDNCLSFAEALCSGLKDDNTDMQDKVTNDPLPEMKHMNIQEIGDTEMDQSPSDICTAEDLNVNIESSVLAKLINIPNTGVAQTTESIAQSCSETTIPAFGSRYIAVEEECDTHDDLRHEQDLLNDYARREGVDVKRFMQNLNESGGGGASEKYEKGEAKHGDKVFQKFVKRLRLYSQQIMRYSYCGEPLYISKYNISTPPACSCGSPRVFELQLMPGVVPLLKNIDYTIEFGTALIYTCRNSCWTENRTSNEEICYIQPDPDQALFR